MLRKRLIASMLSLALLGGCASNDTHPGSDPCVLPPATGNIIYSDLLIPIYLLYGLGCSAARAIDHAAGFHPAPTSSVRDGVYQAADGAFSVALPDTDMRISEQYSPGQDYLLFDRAEGPAYGISVSPALDREYAALTLREYAKLSVRDARFEEQRIAGTPLTHVYEESLSLDGKPALFEVYSQTPAGGRAQVYYLMYFIKQFNQAAILSIAWPADCPKCATGPEQNVRVMNEQLRRFVDSFHLVAATTTD